MTILQFKRLRELKQLKVVKRSGVFLAERYDSQYRYKLYQVEGFYVELIYTFTDNVMRMMDVFEGTASLDPYLDEIHIPFSF
ncbi:MAG TPA: hypothetical protein VLD19_16710 [Chitinophagaceae bacterium]|nr:hypothetical protein [Chitinophagaceae bacterium]